MSEDERLLRAGARGDPYALEELIRRYAPGVHRFLAGMLGDEREAEDVMQEAFVRVARALARYESTTTPRRWIYSMARRVAADHPLARAEPAAPDPLGEGRGWAMRALRSVPAELREVLVLRELCQWGPEDLAEVLETDADGVRTLLASAREALLGQREPAL